MATVVITLRDPQGRSAETWEQDLLDLFEHEYPTVELDTVEVTP
jgi:hypothetical protein